MFPAILAEPPSGFLGQSALFLDFDGTLVDLAPSPDSIMPDDRLPALLDRLEARLHGRLAIVSGRAVDQIRHWLPDFDGVIAGSHGGEIRWPEGRTEAPPRPEALDKALRDARELAARLPGVTIEDKSFGVGLHYRAAPHHAEAVQHSAAQIAARHGLTVQNGKMVAELRCAGFDKGTAIRRLMAEPLFSTATPVFIGDDLTDIPGMEVVTELGGSAIVVGELDCAIAHYRFAGVAQTLNWLEQEFAR